MLSKKSMMFALLLIASSLGPIGWARAGVAHPEDAPQLEASFDLPREEGMASDAFATRTPPASDSIDLPETSASDSTTSTRNSVEPSVPR